MIRSTNHTVATESSDNHMRMDFDLPLYTPFNECCSLFRTISRYPCHCHLASDHLTSVNIPINTAKQNHRSARHTIFQKNLTIKHNSEDKLMTITLNENYLKEKAFAKAMRHRRLVTKGTVSTHKTT
jgi:hypothetical protein